MSKRTFANLVLGAGLILGSAAASAAGPDEEAKAILEATGVKGGLVVHLGCGDGTLTAALRPNDRYLVHGLDRSAENVAKARRHIRSLGMYGDVSVAAWKGDRLPYAENVVNLIVAGDPGELSPDEILRALRPEGVAYLKKDGAWTKIVKPRPAGIDEWSHYLHDSTGNPVAHDSEIAPPRRFQWIGSPRWARHHDRMSSISAMVSSGGRMFYIFDHGSTLSIALPSEWMLAARDAFNGTVLWKRPIAKWHTRLWPLKSGPATLPRRLVAQGDRVYVTLGIEAPVSVLDAATGETIRTIERSAGTEEIIASDGVMFLLVNRDPSTYRPGALAEVQRRQRTKTWDGEERWIMAVKADTGEILWEKKQTVVPMTLAADARRVYTHNGLKIVGLDRTSGNEVWTSEPLPRWKSILSWFAPTLVVYEDVVLFAGGESMVPHRGGKDTMTALSAETGKTLWKAAHPPSGYQSPEDILVAGGLVWTGDTTNGRYSGVLTGRDLKTGEVKSQFPPNVETYWFHHRCHRAKATDKFLLMSRTGIEFVDFRKRDWQIHHWVRGGCLYGIMPCNGLIYTPPHPCACYPEAKLFGFNALAPASKGPRVTEDVAAEARLERGPAYGAEVDETAAPGDWPTLRHDGGRSGRTDTAVPSDLSKVWEAKLGGKLSSAVVAGGRLFVASVNAHTLHALDAKTGRESWSHVAGGRIDSPPTVYRGRVLFGSADGRVTCLRATDGAVIWRYLAAPMDERLVAFEQVESVWPVPGNVLVQDGVAYFVAGRSMFLDGGLRLTRLDALTGRTLSVTKLDDRDPSTGDSLQVNIKTLQMPVALPDVLSSDGRHVYMRSQMFDLDGKRLGVGPHSGIAQEQGSVQRGEGIHLFSPSGIVDDSWFHRAYWVYGRSFAGGHNGYYQAGKFAPAGRILVFDDRNVYGFRRKPQYYKWTTPLEHHLFSSDKIPPKIEAAARRGGQGGSRIRVAKTESLNPAGKAIAVEAWVRAEKSDGVILARGGPAHGYALTLRGGKAQFAVRISDALAAVTSPKVVGGDWAHVAGVLTADKELKLFVNGTLAASGKAPGLIASDPAQAMEIGSDEGGAVGDYTSPFPFTGRIDDVRVYHGAVTDAEIRKHRDAPGETAAAGATLVLRYTFDKNDAADDSGSKNAGKLEGVQFSGGVSGRSARFNGRRGRVRGIVTQMKFHWTKDMPILVRAMVMAGGTLFIAGPPDVLDEEAAFKSLNDPKIKEQIARQSAAIKGREGALLWAVSAADGSKQGEFKLGALPRFDGMAAAGGRLYVVTEDGRVICLGGAK